MSTMATTSPMREKGIEKIPRKQKQENKQGSPCVLPILDGKTSNEKENAVQKYNTQLVEALDREQTFMSGNDFIPLDILTSLTQVPTPPTREQLGPGAKKKLKPLESGVTPAHRRPANVWNYPKGREKLKHLAEQPPCLCGAGRDISFLYDAVGHKCKDKKEPDAAAKPNKIPTSVEKKIREIESMEKDTQEGKEDDSAEAQGVKSQIPNTLVPSEYHIVKNPGVLGLEFYDDKYSTYVNNHEEHLTIFPSMKPAGRGEVLKLKHTMDALLSRAGVDDSDKELLGPTQIHNLLELVKKEQNIYNVCFNEIIRQVTIECAERGELLANLRKRYSHLLDRIPRQVKSLHQEVIAQRALDRRLTEELVRFKASISTLTSELASVKAHDREVTKQAVEAQKELEEALLESEKNASLLTEYHDLYELQRKRLETQVGRLTEERDLWGSAAYILAMKVTNRHSLNTAKKLHLSEKAWARLARHFAIFLSEKDSIQLEALTEQVQLWRETANKYNKQLEVSEIETKNKLTRLVDQWTRWKREFEKVVNYDDGSVTPPTSQFVARLYEDLKSWEEIFNVEAERFTGEVLLAREEELHQMNKQVDKWTDVAMKVFGRHQSLAGERWPQHEEMLLLNQEVDTLHQQFHVRTIGENGVAKGLIDLVNPIETWSNKLDSMLHGGERMHDPEWIRLSDLISNEWLEHLSATILLIGSTQKEGARLAGEPEKKIEVQEIVVDIAKWLSSANLSIENEDGKIIQKVSLIHSAMIRWMITILLRLAPDMEDRDLEELGIVDDKLDMDASIGGGEILLQSTTEEILTRASQLFEDLKTFSLQLTKCSTDLVVDSMQERRDEGDEHADMEFKDLKRLTTESEGWIHTATLQIEEVTGEVHVYEEKTNKTPKQKEEGSTTTETEVVLSVEPPEDGKEAALQADDGRATKSDSNKSTVPSPQRIPTPEPTIVSASPEPLPANEDRPRSGIIKEEADKTQKAEKEKEEEHDEEEKNEGFKMHVLCPDDNIRTKSLDKLPIDQELGLLDVEGSESLPDRSPTPDTKKALEALAAVERLQTQLLETEERAQAAEEKAIQMETDLKQALERIRALERSASRASATGTHSSGHQTPSERAISSKDPKHTVTQSPSGHPRSPSQHSVRASTRSSSRKK